MIYVLTETWQMDSGDCGNEVMAFSTIEKATREMKKRMKKAKQDFKHLDTDQHHYCDGDMAWSIWEAEEYCYNHIDLIINECEVM